MLRGERDTHDEYVFGLQTSRGINNGPEHFGIRAVRDERYRYVLNLTPGVTFTNAIDPEPWFAEWRAAAEAGDAFAQQQVARHASRPAEELYDVEVDPWCLNNLAGSKQHQATRRRLRAVLHAWMAEQGDTGQLIELRAKERQRR